MTIEVLTKDLLKLAQSKGAYREDILNIFYGLAPQKDIEKAIALAKKAGMYSVPDMRNYRLGTWYQYDGEK